MANTAFIIFRNVTIPANSFITRARVKLIAYENDSQINTNVNCYFEDADDPSPPADKSDLDGRSLTSLEPWVNLDEWVDGRIYNSPWVEDLLQEVIDRSGWASGNNVMFVMIDNSSVSDSHRLWSAIDYKEGTEKATLEVVWREPEQIDTPIILPLEIFQTAPFDCSISTQPSDASIYYTIDGSDPDENSTLYAGTFEISEDVTIKAKAYLNYWTPSEISSISYQFVSEWEGLFSYTDNLRYIDAAVDSNGYIHIVYATSVGNWQTDGTLYYATNSSGSWAQETITSLDSHSVWNIYTQFRHMISLDSNDSPHIVYMTDNPSVSGVYLKYARRLGPSNWDTETVISAISPRYTYIKVEYNDIINIYTYNTVAHFYQL